MKKDILTIGRNGKRRESLLVDFDKDIGFTIVDKHDTNEYLYCYIGPSAPNRKDYPDVPVGFDKIMVDYISEAIKSGIYDERELDLKLQKIINVVGNSESASSKHCVFNQ